MDEAASPSLDRLVAAVAHSPKYRRVATDVVRRVGAQALDRDRRLKEAIKATKNHLHRIGGAYLSGRPAYSAWIEQLSEAGPPATEAFKAKCRTILAQHASTRERLPLLERFYTVLFAPSAPVRSIIDIGCGFNPLSAPWMPLAPGATYHAFDMYHDLAEFLNRFFRLVSLRGQAHACDVIRACPPHRVDAALLLKCIPCFEQSEPGSGTLLLDRIDADYLFVSFPRQRLGGRRLDLGAPYRDSLAVFLQARGWPFEQFEFDTETVWRICKRRA
ncbi:MAG TPA: 16S rRNA methyltransferase [Limnochordia bacterium]